MSPKNEFWAEKQHFRPQKRPLWAIGAIKRSAEQPNGHLPENQMYQKLPQDMGKLWPHWVGSVWAQKWGFYGCSVKKSRFFDQKSSFLAQNRFFWDYVQTFCYHHDGTPKRQPFCVDCVARRASLGFSPSESQFWAILRWKLWMLIAANIGVRLTFAVAESFLCHPKYVFRAPNQSCWCAGSRRDIPFKNYAKN